MNKYNVEQMIGKTVVYKGKEYTINNYEVHNYGVEALYFGLKLVKGKTSDKVYIPTKLFEKGDVKTEDKELLDFVAKCNKDFDVNNNFVQEQNRIKAEEQKQARLQQAKDEEARKQASIIEEQEQATLRGKEDARNKISVLYRAFTHMDAKSLSKALNYSSNFRKAYCTAYEAEKKVMKQERLFASRCNYNTLSEYPGDLDELIKWMRDNLLRIDVFASPDKIENEQMAVDALNERDGTNYQVKIRQGQYVAYEAMFKNPTSAPREFLSWMVSKHDYTTSDLNQRVMAHPMNVETGKMTCNALVKELIYNSEYAFHVGKAN